MRNRCYFVLTFFCLIFTIRPAAAATPEQVDAAIDKAKKFLYSQMIPASGIWDAEPKTEPHGPLAHSWGGFTAVATYALLAAGDSHQDPRLQKALKFLKGDDIDLMYALGLRAQIWDELPDNGERKRLVKRDGDIFSHAINRTNSPYRGLYHYGVVTGPAAATASWHNSTSQYGVLGMWACEQAGYEVPLSYWEMVDTAWRKNQGKDGGWSYLIPPGPTQPEIATMTAAGIATLFITNDYLHANDGVNCKGNITNSNIESGLDWMSKHFAEIGGNTYGLYGIERIGVASGRKYFGSTDWFAVGAQTLLTLQTPTGQINGPFGPVADTSLALVFLARGRAPVAINKLQYELAGGAKKGAEGNWNQRPRDVANVVRWTGHNMEQDLNWQVVNLKVAADDLHDAPILYISGDQTLSFPPDQMAKLKDFVESGGMILGNADCAKPEFIDSFERLGSTLFGREFRVLAAGHPIFNEQYHGKAWAAMPKVRGMTNDVRELMVLLPDTDPARSWQTRADQTKLQSFQLGADLIQYAADKQSMHNKGDTYIVRVDPKIPTNRTMKVARLQVGTNWDPEPGGWRRLAAIMHNRYALQVDVEPVKFVDQPLAGYQLATLTGTTKFKLTDAQRARLLEFTEHGGTLLIDAAGGSGAFADSAESELSTMFGADAKAIGHPLPITSPFYTNPYAPIDAVSYRAYCRSRLVGSLKSPRLVGITHGTRIVAFYSREDLSGGMVGNDVDGVLGYTPVSATDIVRNVLLMTGPKPLTPPPPPPPAPK